VISQLCKQSIVSGCYLTRDKSSFTNSSKVNEKVNNVHINLLYSFTELEKIKLRFKEKE